MSGNESSAIDMTGEKRSKTAGMCVCVLLPHWLECQVPARQAGQQKPSAETWDSNSNQFTRDRSSFVFRTCTFWQ